MKKKQLTIALSAVFAVSLAGAGVANAVDTSDVVDAAKDMAKEAMADAPGRDMAGNLVNYNYGGDSKGAYAGGKVGTGAKDPGVCGTFTEAICGADGGGHLK